MCLFHKVSLFTGIGKSYVVPCIVNGLKSGNLGSGKFTMTLHLHTQQLLHKYSIPQVRQPPFSPDMVLCEFVQCPELSYTLNRQNM